MRGEEVNRTVTLSNEGAASLQLDSIERTSGDPVAIGDSASADARPFGVDFQATALAPGASTSVQVVFHTRRNMADDGEHEATVQIHVRGTSDAERALTLRGHTVAPSAMETTVQGSGVTLFKRTAGTAKSVVIAVHGGPGLSSHYMQSLDRLAGAGRMMVTYDQRGSGRSGQPQPPTFSLADYVADLEVVRQSVGVQKVHLLGHSWGSLIAQQYAATHPDNVASLTLYGGEPLWSSDVAAGFNRFDARVMQLQAAGKIPMTLPASRGDDCTPSLAALLPAYLYNPDFQVPEEVHQITCSDSVTGKTYTALGSTFDYRPGVNSLAFPLMVFFGKGDPFGSQWGEATLAAFQATQGSLVLLENCGHFWQECPDAFYPAWEAFLDKAALSANE
jgi:proline iminopeptidase